MKCRRLLLPLALVVLSLPVYSHQAFTGALTLASLSGNYPAVTALFHPTRVTVESILDNPAVHKKQLAPDLIQAIGHPEAVQAHFIIHFRKEELHGEWESFYTNNRRCDSGRFYRNLPTGEWRTWYPDGRLKTVRTYNAEKYQYIKADLQRNHPKVQRYVLTRMGSKNAAPYFRPQHKGQPDVNQPLSILQKLQLNTSGDGTSYVAPFATCLHHGAFVNYDANGHVTDSGHYVNGLKDGLWKEALKNGAMQSLGLYRHGVRQGQWKYYNANGRLVYTEHYNANGKRKNWHYFDK